MDIPAFHAAGFTELRNIKRSGLLTHEGHARPRVVLLAGHSSDPVVQDHKDTPGLVHDSIDQSRDPRVEES